MLGDKPRLGAVSKHWKFPLLQSAQTLTYRRMVGEGKSWKEYSLPMREGRAMDDLYDQLFLAAFSTDPVI